MIVPGIPFELAPVTVVVGHYGTGKTNLSMNLALDAAAAGIQTVLVDLDIVNPYFRSSDYTDLLEAQGVKMVAPVLARSSLDTPSLSAAVGGAIEWAQRRADGFGFPTADASGEGTAAGAAPERLVILDVGGDDVGATALGRFSEMILREPYEMLYVVNKYRNLTQDAASAVEIIREIQDQSGLVVSAVANNSHLRQCTEASTILEAFDFGGEVADLLSVPLVLTTYPRVLLSEATAVNAFNRPDAADGVSSATTGDVNSLATLENAYPVTIHVKTPWELE